MVLRRLRRIRVSPNVGIAGTATSIGISATMLSPVVLKGVAMGLPLAIGAAAIIIRRRRRVRR